MENKKYNERYLSLMVRFITMFALFVAVALVLTGTLSYINETAFYHTEVERSLRNATDYVNSLMAAEGESFPELKQYIYDHRDELHIPANAPDGYEAARADFDRLWASRRSGSAPADVPFSSWDPELQLAYARYYYQYWLYLLEHAMDDFGLIYTYFVFPTSEEEHMMCYLYTGVREEEDGELIIAGTYEQDPAIHRYMWEAWDKGTAPEGMDIVDNEFGKVYCYSAPLWVDGEKIGLLCAEIFVESVNVTIRDMTLTQSAIALLVLAICSAAMILAIRSLVLRRIYRLEGHMEAYARDKDPAVAKTVEAELRSERSSDEISTLSGGFSEMVCELDNYMRNLEAVTAERERIGAELNVATEIQASMLPNIFPPFPDRKEFCLFASMDPAKEVGGDFYDFFFVDDNHLAIVIADVSGKGVPAALFMVIAKTLVKNHAQAGEPVETVLANSNNQLCEGNGGELFVTTWIGILDLRNGELSFSEAGHENPLLLHRDGTVETLKPKRKRPPLATLEGLKFLPNTIRLQPGDTVFLYTDGVPEATNAQDELFGMERLEACLREHTADTPDKLLPAVRKTVDTFVGEAPQFDDLTMLALQLREISPS